MKFLLSITIAFTFIVNRGNAQIPELWGTTVIGDSTGANPGIIFKINGDGSGFTVKHIFSNSTGWLPIGGLMLASDGNFYGVTSGGGNYNWGVLFSYNPLINVYTNLHDFNPFPDGAYPQTGIVEAPNGKLYETTATGGANGKGIIFCYDPGTSNYSILHDFDMNYGYPIVALTPVANILYGMTSMGNSIFSYDLNTNNFTNLIIAPSSGGIASASGLIQTSSNELFGTMVQGGLNVTGLIFKYDMVTSMYIDVYDFDSLSNNNGGNPTGRLVFGNNDFLYGLTYFGGISNYNGTIFSYNIMSNTYSNLFQFAYSDGSYPAGCFMMQASDNNLYGIMYNGGTDSLGVIFKYDIISNSFMKLLDFDGTNGANPIGGLVELITTGLPQSQQTDEYLTINPNPATDFITINSNIIYNPEQINIIDVTGRQIDFGIINPNCELNISKLQQGVYFLKFNDKSKMFIKK